MDTKVDTKGEFCGHQDGHQGGKLLRIKCWCRRRDSNCPFRAPLLSSTKYRYLLHTTNLAVFQRVQPCHLLHCCGLAFRTFGTPQSGYSVDFWTPLALEVFGESPGNLNDLDGRICWTCMVRFHSKSLHVASDGVTSRRPLASRGGVWGLERERQRHDP